MFRKCTTLLDVVNRLQLAQNIRSCSSHTSYTPRRALLYVPGHDTRKVEKAIKLQVDSIALDCEDGVAINKKADARDSIRAFLEKGKPQKARPYDLGVRVNALDTEYFADDVNAVLSGKNLPDTLLVPKVNTPQQVNELGGHIKRQLHGKIKKIDLIIYIESALAVINVVDICKAAIEHGRTSGFELSALVFGGDDFLADIGAAKSDNCEEVSYARQKVVLVAKAFRLQAIDVVHIKFKELEQLKQLSEYGSRLGYTGKQVIHPDQVPIVQQAFMPTKLQVEWATGLLKAFEQHQKAGKGAFTYRGSMIDMPTMKQAKNIMKLIEFTS